MRSRDSLQIVTRAARFRESSGVRVALAAGLFAYLVWARTLTITRTFGLLGDQMLYWSLALRPWYEQPLSGGPSSIGGTTVGPVFFWTLWIIRQIVGPFTQNLPHAGGIGISILQSAADVLLFLALSRRTGSLAFALGATLFIGTAPFDMSLTASIWNPPVAVAFVKVAIALLVGVEATSAWRAVGIITAAVLAVQAHSSAVFVAVPVIASLTVRELLARRAPSALRQVMVTFAVIAVLETPLLISVLRQPDRSVASPILTADVAHAIAHPASLRFADSWAEVTSAADRILLAGVSPGLFQLLVAACLVLTVFLAFADITTAAVSVAPVLCAVVGFSAWQRAYDTYWFMPVAPSVALTCWFATVPWPRLARGVAIALLVLVVLAQPTRIATSLTLHRVPEYGAMLQASREMARRTPEVSGVTTAFPLPPTADPAYLYVVLGGRVNRAAPYAAIIERNGAVRFVAHRAAP